MEMKYANLKEKLSALKTGKLTAEQNVSSFLEEIQKQETDIHAFLELNTNALDDAQAVDRKIKEGKAGKLAGLAIAVKSNINVRGMHASCASKTLENYTAAYDATVIEKLRKEDAVIIGMTNMDEFAAGSSGETSAFGPTKNPLCKDRIPGGSSSGS